MGDADCGRCAAWLVRHGRPPSGWDSANYRGEKGSKKESTITQDHALRWIRVRVGNRGHAASEEIAMLSPRTLFCEASGAMIDAYLQHRRIACAGPS